MGYNSHVSSAALLARQAGYSPGHSWDSWVSGGAGWCGRRSRLPLRDPPISGPQSVKAGGPQEPAGAGWPEAIRLPSSGSSLYFYPLLPSPLGLGLISEPGWNVTTQGVTIRGPERKTMRGSANHPTPSVWKPRCQSSSIAGTYWVCLLCAGHCAKRFICINSFYLNRWGNWESHRLSCLSKFT